MSRRKPDVDHMQVILDVVCAKGHRVGMIAKRGSHHPDPNPYLVGLPLRFEDLPSPTPTSGKVRGVCEKCGDDVQITWLRAREELDAHEARGRHTGTLRATTGR